jgi:transcriptional regulator GlxA family with amidase domain
MKSTIFAAMLVVISAMVGAASVFLVGGIPPTSAADVGELGVKDSKPPKKDGPRNVAIFVHEGVELLDFAGPGEVFAAAGHGRAFNVYTVAASPGPILSQRFVTVTPQYTLANCPKPDIIVLPGGRTDLPLADPNVIEWIKTASRDAEVTLSVCTGAFLLARAGLLDGVEATTHWGSIEDLRGTAPKTKVLENLRYVDSGRVVTSAGVSAGIDGALHVVDRLLGRGPALQTARYMEYKWEPGDSVR